MMPETDERWKPLLSHAKIAERIETMSEPWHYKTQREAGERLAALIALPVPEDQYDVGAETVFDPWTLFPLYGTYSSDFDECALSVLRELNGGSEHRYDLASEFFREMLCNLDLCDYGTSPRACFPTSEFRALLPELIHKWEAYSRVAWSGQDAA